MNRQIIFRGKRLDNGEWVYGYFIKLSDGVCHIFSPMKDTTQGEFYNWKVDPATVGQYTGLKDCNGVEIYEGDILQCPSVPNIPLEVRYNTLQGAFCLVEHTHSEGALLGTCPLGEMLRHYPDMSVIGNRFDNPDLLNGK